MKLFRHKAAKTITIGVLILCLCVPFLAACQPKKSPTTYTYTQYMTTTPSTFNPHRVDTEDERNIASLITDPLLTFSLSSDGTSYEVTPSLAKALPTDITASMKGRSGVPATAQAGDGYAWRFEIRQDAVWEDGTAINAKTFQYSLEQLLEKDFSNKRAADFTTGRAAIYGAYSYMHSDSIIFKPAITDNLDAYTDEWKEEGAQIHFGWQMPMPNILVEFFADTFSFDLNVWADLYAVMPEAFSINNSDGEDEDIYTKWDDYFSSSEKGTLLIINDASYGLVLAQEEEGLLNRISADLVQLMDKWLNAPASEDDSGYYYGFGEQIASYGDANAQWVDNIINDAMVGGTDPSSGDPTPPWIYELFLGVQVYIPELTWSNVGFKDNSNPYVFDVVFQTPIKDMYELCYYFASKPFLIHKASFDALKSVTEGGAVRTTYGTTADTTISYGPYSIKSAGTGSISLTKNNKWLGYSLPMYKNEYQTTNIVIKTGVTQSSALEEFLKGNYSEVNLTAQNLSQYSESDYLHTYTDAKTYKLVLNSDRSKLQEAQNKAGANINKVMLSYKDFRQAISLSINRSALSETISPMFEAGFGLVNRSYLSNPQNKTIYRDEMLAKLAVVAASIPSIAREYETITSPWNPSNFMQNVDSTIPSTTTTYGERLNLMYAILKGESTDSSDPYYSSLNGQDLVTAKELFISAFNEAINAGDYDSTQTVTINLVCDSAIGLGGLYTPQAALQAYIDMALSDTPFEGKVLINQASSQNTATLNQNLRQGLVDTAIVSSNGNQINALSIIDEAYINDLLRQEYGLKGNVTKNIPITLKISGLEKTLSLWQWASALCGDVEVETTSGTETVNYQNASYETRLRIATALEYYWLGQYCSIPISYSMSGVLLSKQISYKAESYMPYIGFGGIRYITYNYTDEAWTSFIKTSSNLNY